MKSPLGTTQANNFENHYNFQFHKGTISSNETYLNENLLTLNYDSTYLIQLC